MISLVSASSEVKSPRFGQRRHLVDVLEGLEAEGLVDARTVPEPAGEGMDGARRIAFRAEERGERGDRLAHILLVRGNAARRQEGVGEARQRLEFDIGGEAAEFRREDVAARISRMTARIEE